MEDTFSGSPHRFKPHLLIHHHYPVETPSQLIFHHDYLEDRDTFWSKAVAILKELSDRLKDREMPMLTYHGHFPNGEMLFDVDELHDARSVYDFAADARQEMSASLLPLSNEDSELIFILMAIRSLQKARLEGLWSLIAKAICSPPVHQIAAKEDERSKIWYRSNLSRCRRRDNWHWVSDRRYMGIARSSLGSEGVANA